MTIKITEKQYKELIDALYAAESYALEGIDTQVQFDPVAGLIWTTQFSEGEGYKDAPYIEIYSMKAHTLKDLYGDDDTGVDWEDENYETSEAYVGLKDWHFDDCNDGFRAYEILDEALEHKDIEVETNIKK